MNRNHEIVKQFTREAVRIALSHAMGEIRNAMYAGCPATERPGLNRAMDIIHKIKVKIEERNTE